MGLQWGRLVQLRTQWTDWPGTRGWRDCKLEKPGKLTPIMRFLLAASTLSLLLLASPGYAQTNDVYQLRQGESPAVVVARTYGDKAYLAVLKFHARTGSRSRTMRLPSLRQIMVEERVQSLEPNAVEKLLQAQADLYAVTKDSSATCSPRQEWQPKQREVFQQAARDVGQAAALLKEGSAPRVLVTRLERASQLLQGLGDQRGKAACKSIKAIHKSFASAMASSVAWARSEHRRRAAA